MRQSRFLEQNWELNSARETNEVVKQNPSLTKTELGLLKEQTLN